MPAFALTDCYDVGEHHFRVYHAPANYHLAWLVPMAREYIRLLSHSQERIENIRSHLADLNMDMTSVERRLKQNSVPKRRYDNFDVMRSDFGELLCYMLLEENYSTVIGAKSIEIRELTDAPGRGIDAIGIEERDGKLVLVLCEVKVSDDRTSPPGVVERREDCLKNQQLMHIEQLFNATKRKIQHCAKLVRDRQRSAQLDLVSALLEFGFVDDLKVVSCCVLVRPASLHRSQDFGSFYTNPDQFQPATVRFLIPCLPHPINDIINEWDDVIRHEVAQ